MNLTSIASSALVLPFWSGERSTGWHSEAMGTISHLTKRTSRGDVLLGIVEGMILRCAAILKILMHHNSAPKGEPGQDSMPSSSGYSIVVSGAVLEKSKMCLFNTLILQCLHRSICV